MINIQIKQAHSTKLRQTQRIMARIRIANLLSLPEDKYSLLIREIENNPLFKRLMYPDNKYERIFSYKRFPMTRMAGSFYEFREEQTAVHRGSGTAFLSVESMLEGKDKIIRLIRNIGEEKFKSYFLFNEDKLSLRDVADKCKIKKDDAENIIDLLNTVDVYNAFFDSQAINNDKQKRYTKIASIKKVQAEDKGSGVNKGFFIEFFSVNSAKGKYIIDHEKIKILKDKKYLSREEVKALNRLIRDMELVNTRKTTIYRVIERIIDKQYKYLKSNNMKDLVPFTEKQLAAEIDVDGSVISRSVLTRSIETPWGMEKPIKDFLPSKKDVRKELIYNIIYKEDVPYTDNEIRDKLKKDFGIVVSRRSVASCRLEMDLPSNYRRKNRR